MNIPLKSELVAILTELENLPGVDLPRRQAHRALAKAVAADDLDYIRLHYCSGEWWGRMGSVADDYIPDKNRSEYTRLLISLVQTFEAVGIHYEPALWAANLFQNWIAEGRIKD